MRMLWYLATVAAFVGGLTLLSMSELNAKHWHSFLKVDGWTLWIMVFFHILISGGITTFGPIHFEVLRNRWGFLVKSVLEIAVCSASTWYLNFIVKRKVLDLWLIFSLIVFASHSLSLGRILWPGTDITCMLLFIQMALSLGIEKNIMGFIIIGGIGFGLFLIRAFLDSRDIVRRAQQLKGNQDLASHRDGGAVETRGIPVDVEADERTGGSKMRRFVCFLCASAFFVGSVSVLTMSKLNLEHWNLFLNRNSWALWTIVVIYFFCAGLVAKFGPIRYEILANRWGFLLKSILEVAVCTGTTWFLNFIVEKKALDHWLISSLMMLAFQSLSLGRILWPGVDICCMVLFIEMAMNVAIELDTKSFIITGAIGFCLYLVRAYFESYDIIHRAQEIETSNQTLTDNSGGTGTLTDDSGGTGGRSAATEIPGAAAGQGGAGARDTHDDGAGVGAASAAAAADDDDHDNNNDDGVINNLASAIMGLSLDDDHP